MTNKENKTSKAGFISLKTVIRTKDFEASKAFYTQILKLETVQEYDDGDGSRGVILRLGPPGSNAFLEISEISDQHSYYQAAFSQSFEDDKTDIQISTDDVNYWAELLKEKWSAKGPVLRPWGSYYLYLRDPDGLQIIIYQEKKV
ncbi:VOC family protein [Poritiphilus flavus]|uniref:VOC domain-containing protein n=1 Tax=Poritiphilus flavus TaxID=2697053 RepID=A0A6L9EGT7_9FLAO|nr:VOC family protein [Poritiphilus flavus]NAS13891.1 hypothetical protein [Poritiphilus flavus]